MKEGGLDSSQSACLLALGMSDLCSRLQLVFNHGLG